MIERHDALHNDIQHNDTQHKGIICDTQRDSQEKGTLIKFLCYYAECHYAQCRILFTIMLNVIMPSVIKLNVVMPSVVMLSVLVHLIVLFEYPKKILIIRKISFCDNDTLSQAPMNAWA